MERFELTEESWLDHGVLDEKIVSNFDKLWMLHPEEYSIVIIYGKTLPTPRWQESYIKPYVFSGVSHGGGDLPDILKPYLDWVNSLGYGTFNQVFLNWYENGSHYIGAHSDDERQLKKNSYIVSISFGAERKFRIRDKKDGEILADIILCDRDTVVMCGKFQKELTHEIVKIGGKKGKDIGRRINITFRQFIE